jgi:hypothetical protein
VNSDFNSSTTNKNIPRKIIIPIKKLKMEAKKDPVNMTAMVQW